MFHLHVVLFSREQRIGWIAHELYIRLLRKKFLLSINCLNKTKKVLNCSKNIRFELLWLSQQVWVEVKENIFFFIYGSQKTFFLQQEINYILYQTVGGPTMGLVLLRNKWSLYDGRKWLRFSNVIIIDNENLLHVGWT